VCAPITVQSVMQMKGCVCTNHRSSVCLKYTPSGLGESGNCGSWSFVEPKSSISCFLEQCVMELESCFGCWHEGSLATWLASFCSMQPGL
jgi:hypothetical protein